MPVSSAGEETTTTARTAGILGTVALVLVAGSAPAADECLAGWRVQGGPSGSGNQQLVCRDGDPRCDADGVADGTCTIATALCLNVGACTPADVAQVAIEGAEPLAALTAALSYPVRSPGVCVGPTPVRLPLDGRRARRAVLRAQVEAGGRRDVDRLRMVCRRASTASGGRALVVTTDFETGRLATLGLRSPSRLRLPDTPVHSDAVVRTGGGMAFVVNRFLGDNVQRLDPEHGFRTRLECSTGPGSNPHDIAVVAPDKAYVTRYDRAELWIVDPSVTSCDRFRRGTIDLAAFADGDGLPEMSQMAVAGGRLFVALQRLDRRRGFAPTGPSRLVVIDLATDAVLTTVTLFGANAFGDSSGIVHEPGTGRLVLATPGDIYRVGDGGLERVDPDLLTSEGRFFATEDALGGNVTDFVLLSADKGYAVVQAADLKNHLVAFDPSGARPPHDVFVRDGFVPDLALAPDGSVWVADMTLPTPGILVIDPATDRLRRRQPLDVGLPPFSIGFVP